MMSTTETNNQNLPLVPEPPTAKQSPLRYIIFAIASLLSVLILAAGWEMFILVPLGGLLIAILVTILVIIFRKKQTDNFTITVAFAIIFFSIFSFRINSGVVTDAEKLSYWGSMFLGDKLEFFHSPYFDLLATVTIIFFIFGMIYLVTSVAAKGKLGKIEGVALLSFFALLLAAHFYVVKTESRQYLDQLASGRATFSHLDTEPSSSSSTFESTSEKQGIKMEFMVPLGNCNDKSESIIKGWINSFTYQITAHVIINCCNTFKNGDFEMQGDKLVLKFDNVGSDACNCVCGHDLIYNFTGLEEKEYEIEINQNKIITQNKEPGVEHPGYTGDSFDLR
jgi:hypothetical protein